VFSGPGRTADDVISRDVPWFQRYSTVQYSVNAVHVMFSFLSLSHTCYHPVSQFNRIGHNGFSLKILSLFLLFAC
jgi:hypothetical protein